MLFDQETFQLTPIPPKEEEEKKKEILPTSPQIPGEFGLTPIPLKGAPEPEKESIFDKIGPLLSQVKDFAPKLAPYIPGIGEALARGKAARIESEKPQLERPGFYAPTGEERRVGIEEEIPPVSPYPREEELEYGKFEKLLDIPGQFLTSFAKMFGWGLPEFIPGEEPAPKSEVAEVTGALGHLVGLAGGGAGKAAVMAPFKVSGAIAKRIWAKPAKTTVGKIAQNMLKNANTLGLALGATEWEGGDAKEILRNKAQAFVSGEAIGAFFGGMQFVHFAKESPILSFVIRYGMGSALLDLADNKHPLDERTLFTKAYDYGLNAYFLQHGVSPKQYQRASEGLLKEIKRFNQDAKKDNLKIQLPESLEHIRKIVGEPGEWIQPGEEVTRRITPPADRFATEKTILPPEMGEQERIRYEYQERAGRPPEETVINIRQREDKSWDIKLPTAKVEPTIESPKELAMGSFLAAHQNYPRILYESISKSSMVKEGTVTPKEVVEYIEARGKEVIEKPDVIPGPEVKPEVTRAPQVGFKDPLLNAIAEDVRKIRPSADYSRQELLKAGLPFRLIAAKSDTTYPSMDVAAQTLAHRFPEIKGDVDLYDMLKARKLGPLGVEAKSEKERAEDLEKYYEEQAEELAEKEMKPTPEQIAEQKMIHEQAAKGGTVRPIATAEAVPMPEITKEKAEALKKDLARKQAELMGEKPTTEAEEKKIYRISPELKAIEKALKESKELTEEQKEFLKEKGAYEFKPAPEEKPLMEPEEIAAMEGPKQEFIRVTVETPTGTIEDLGELPVDKIGSIKTYAKELGLEGKVTYSKPRKGTWKDYLPPTEIEKHMKDIIRDVKKRPKEEWEKWEKEVDDEYNKLYSGLPPPEFVRTAGMKILSKLQIEPQFKALGAPDTGFHLKAYHPRRNAEAERGEVAVKNLMKIGKKFGLKEDDYLKLTFLTSLPGYFKPMSPKERAKFSRKGDQNTPYRIVRRFFDEYEPRLVKLGIIEEGWPKSQLRRLREERTHLKASLEKPLKEMGKARKAKVKKRIVDITETIETIQKRHPRYVGIPRMWFELIWDRNPRTAPRIVTELFKQRETVEIDKLADYLINTKFRELIPKEEWDLYKKKDLDRPLLKKEDMDIRRMMYAYAHKVGHKMALAEIFNAAKKEGLLKDTDLAPQSWTQLPSWKYPTLKGKRAHPAFTEFFEKNFERQGFLPPKLGGVLGTVKLFQFYNPLFLPMYDTVQAWWSGSVRSTKTPANIKNAFLSMKNKDKAYWDMHDYGGFSTPYTPSFEQYLKKADRLLKTEPFLKKMVKLKFLNPYEWYKLSWHTAWTGDHFIRMITNHHYLAQGKSPREAAQFAAKLHADYASIPPATRKWMNKLFFTPSFKISMLAAQAEMVKSAGKVMVKGRKAGDYDKTMAKALVGLASGVALRQGIMDLLGFETDQFGLRYFKKITDEEGNEKELVLITSSPDNVALRFWHRFSPLLPFIGSEEKKLEGLTNRAKWELHPMWQLTQEVYTNKSVSLEPIWDPFDKKSNPEKIMWDVLKYSTQRILRFTEVIPGSESLKRYEAYNAMVKDLGKFGIVLSGFALPYTRTTRERALVYEINRLKSQFKYMNNQKPAKTEADAERRFNNFRSMLEDIVKRLDELREKE